jgi:hypothetical protein
MEKQRQEREEAKNGKRKRLKKQPKTKLRFLIE